MLANGRETLYDGGVPRYRDSELLAAFGQAVRIARTRLGMSQAELAMRASPPIGRARLGAIELGQRDPGLTIIDRIARALGMTLAQLMDATAQELRRREAGERAERRASPPAARPPAEVGAKPEGDARPSVVSCYIVQDGRLLMLRRRFPSGALEWTALSGEIEPGETPEEAAAREAMEEIGVAVVVEERLGERVHPETGRHLIYLVGRILSGDTHLVDHDENSEVEWVSIPEALERWANLKGGVFPPVREYLVASMAAERRGGS